MMSPRFRCDVDHQYAVARRPWNMPPPDWYSSLSISTIAITIAVMEDTKYKGNNDVVFTVLLAHSIYTIPFPWIHSVLLFSHSSSSSSSSISFTICLHLCIKVCYCRSAAVAAGAVISRNVRFVFSLSWAPLWWIPIHLTARPGYSNGNWQLIAFKWAIACVESRVESSRDDCGWAQQLSRVTYSIYIYPRLIVS